MIHLCDDGTLDTVLCCSKCGEEFRFNYDASSDPCGSKLRHETVEGSQACYDDFVSDCITEVESEHVCHYDIPDTDNDD